MSPMKRAWRDIAYARVGHRGAFLSFLVVLDVLFGYSLLVLPRAQLGDLNLLLPVHVWGILWIVVGCGILTGVPTRRDRAQFTLAAVFKAIWAAVYADLWIVQGFPHGWVSVVIWLAFAGTVLVVAAWPEPPIVVALPSLPTVYVPDDNGDSPCQTH